MKLPALLLAAALLCPFARAADAPATKPDAPAETKAPRAPEKAQAFFQRLMNAIELNDHEAFVADADADFKAAATPAVVADVNKQLAPRLAKGEPVSTYFGQLKQQGCDMYLWRLVFADGDDDLLATLVVKGGKVAGFFAR